MTKLRSILLLAFSAGLLGCDHATKLAAEHELGAGKVVTVVPSVLELRYARNHDVAFNALSQWDLPHRNVVLLVVAALVTALTIAMWVRHRKNSEAWNMGDAGYALVVAGAFGNLLDRLIRGYVVDFIHLTHWPIFNVADACVVFGLIALGLSRSKARAVVSPRA